MVELNVLQAGAADFVEQKKKMDLVHSHSDKCVVGDKKVQHKIRASTIVKCVAFNYIIPIT